MAKGLGERIKNIRKELKMTQTQLAGSEMTKSMLSQIENNLAMPSMKNLHYLASRLNKPMSYFLEDDDYHDSMPLEDIYEDLKRAADLIDNRKQDEALEKLEAMFIKYNFDHESKLYADFLSKYGDCLIYLKRFKEGEEKIKEAVNIYKSKFLFVDASRAYTILIGIPWNSFDYQKCMDILEESLEIYNNSIIRDYAYEIETLYYRSLLCAGLDNLEGSIAATTKALEISKQTNIYYKSDELYKNLAVMNGFLGKLEHFDEYIDKARQFATFTENKGVLASIEGVCGLYENQKGNPEKALKYMEKVKQLSKNVTPFALAEQAKSYYMLKDYQKALDTIGLIKYPTHTPFKYDYLHIWSAKVYEGLCLNELGKKQNAATAIKQGIEKMEIVKESKALAFAYKSLSEVYSDMGDFESALTALRKANEIADIAKSNRLYY